MPAFRILDQSPVYLDLQGQLAAGGTLHFYAAGSTTDKDVYGDQALTVNNGPTIAIGSDGRAVDDIWGDGSYRVRLYAADGTLVFDRDDVEIAGGTGTAIPALLAGKFLTNDGAVLQWLDLLQPPDPGGQSGKVIGSDGTSLVWQTPASAVSLPTGGIAQTAASFTIGKFMVQVGGDTASASGGHTTSKVVPFATSMASCLAVLVIPEIAGVTSSGFNAIGAVQSRNGAGFTVQFDINEASGGTITNAIPFRYVALGLIP